MQINTTKAKLEPVSLQARCSVRTNWAIQALINNRQVEQKPGGRGRGREWATLGVHPLSWLLSNNRLEKVLFVSVPHTSSNRLLLSNQDKGCTPGFVHSLPLPLGPALLNLWTMISTHVIHMPLLSNSTRNVRLNLFVYIRYNNPSETHKN